MSHAVLRVVNGGTQVLRVIFVLFLLIPGQELKPWFIKMNSFCMECYQLQGGSGKGEGIWPDGSSCRAGI